MTIPGAGLLFGPPGHFTLRKHERVKAPTGKPRDRDAYQFTALEFTEPGAWDFLWPRSNPSLDRRGREERNRDKRRVNSYTPQETPKPLSGTSEVPTVALSPGHGSWPWRAGQAGELAVGRKRQRGGEHTGSPPQGNLGPMARAVLVGRVPIGCFCPFGRREDRRVKGSAQDKTTPDEIPTSLKL